MQPGRGVDHPLSLSAEVKEKVVIPLFFRCVFVVGNRENFNASK
jgi:hypothetical protein